MWSKNTNRESSHIFFFFGGDPFCEAVRQPENTRGRADRSAWVTSGSLPSVQNYRLYIVFSSPMRKYEYPLSLKHFLFKAGYGKLHNSVLFFGNLLILFANGNIYHSIHRQQITFSPSSCETTLLMLACNRIESAMIIPGTPSSTKLGYYIATSINIHQFRIQGHLSLWLEAF